MNPKYQLGFKIACHDPTEALIDAPNRIFQGFDPLGRGVELVTKEGHSLANIRFRRETQPPTGRWELTVVAEFEPQGETGNTSRIVVST